MRLLIILFLLLPTLLFSQEYHIRGCDSRFYKIKTYKVLVGEDAVEYEFCEDRWWWPNGKYYFYYDVDTLLKKPYQYQVYKNGSSTYRKTVGKRKMKVYRDFGYFNYYDNGCIREIRGGDSDAFDREPYGIKNFGIYYDSLGHKQSEYRQKLLQIDEQYFVRWTLLEFNILGDTSSYSVTLSSDEYGDGKTYNTFKKEIKYDSITGKRVEERRITTTYKEDDLIFCCENYWEKDTTTLKFNESGNIIAKAQNTLVGSDKYTRKESYLNDSLVYYHFELTRDFNFNDSDCNYAEFHSNGMPKYLKMSYCEMDTLITKYDSTGEETYREEFIVTKHYNEKIQRAKRYTYLYKPNRQRYLIKKEVCRRKRCRCWWYDNDGKLVKKKRYRKQYQ